MTKLYSSPGSATPLVFARKLIPVPLWASVSLSVSRQLNLRCSDSRWPLQLAIAWATALIFLQALWAEFSIGWVAFFHKLVLTVWTCFLPPILLLSWGWFVCCDSPRMYYKCWWNCPQYFSPGPRYLPKNLTQVRANFKSLPKARQPSLRCNRGLGRVWQSLHPSIKIVSLALTWAFLKRKWTRIFSSTTLWQLRKHLRDAALHPPTRAQSPFPEPRFWSKRVQHHLLAHSDLYHHGSSHTGLLISIFTLLTTASWITLPTCVLTIWFLWEAVQILPQGLRSDYPVWIATLPPTAP